MFSFFRSTSYSENSLVISIDSRSVSVGFVSYSNNLPHIKHGVTVYYGIEKKTEGKFLAVKMRKALDDALETTLKHGIIKSHNNKIKSVHIVLASPWIMSKVSHIQQIYDKDVEISRADIGNHIEKHSKQLETDMRAEFNMGTGVKVVEQKVLGILLNGYEMNIDTPKTAHTLDIHFLVSMINTTLIDDINRSISKFVHSIKESFHSSFILEFAGMRALHHGFDEAIIMTLHSECSDIAIVKKNIPSLMASTTYGTKDMLRTLAEKTRSSTEEVESILKLFAEDNLDNTKKEQIVQNLKYVSSEWTQKFREAIDQIDDKAIVPCSILISGPEPYRHLVTEFLKGTYADVDSPYATLCHFEEFNQDMFNETLVFSQGVFLENLPLLHILGLQSIVFRV